MTPILLSKKHSFYIPIFLFTITILVQSCDVFEKAPLDSIPEEDVWNNPTLANLYLNNLYQLTLPKFSGTSNSGISDESPGEGGYMYGQLTKESVGDFSNETYSKIRKINLLISKIETGKIPIKDVKLIKGQAHFLRAWTYWNLVKLYGGVPMILDVQSMSIEGYPTEETMVRRNKTKECIEIIAADLDTAFAYLPATWLNKDIDYGRIIRGAALALKGRVLLFWASPQFNPQNKTERWQWAYVTNKMAIDTLTKDGYGLHSSFKELFENCAENTKEAIFVRVYNEKIPGGYYHNYDNSVRPKVESKSGGSSNFPTWQLVRAYPMVDGYPVDSTSTTYKYNENRYYVNRDKRFYYTIAYNSCTWPLSSNASNKIWTYYYWNVSGSTPLLSSTEGTAYSPTGFYCRKYVNPTIDKSLVDKIGTDWMEIRYAEVLLNFAECANELNGKENETKDAFNQIRNGRTDIKVGMDYINKHINNQTIMREIIMTERQIELAFENKRYWDLRRRNMFINDLGPSIKKLNGTKRTGWKVERFPHVEIFPGVVYKPTHTEDYIKSVRNNQDFTVPIVYNTYFVKTYRDTLDIQYSINFLQPQYNFYPIQQTNIDKNPNLEQTTYWGGSFDPLEE